MTERTRPDGIQDSSLDERVRDLKSSGLFDVLANTFFEKRANELALLELQRKERALSDTHSKIESIYNALKESNVHLGSDYDEGWSDGVPFIPVFSDNEDSDDKVEVSIKIVKDERGLKQVPSHELPNAKYSFIAKVSDQSGSNIESPIAHFLTFRGFSSPGEDWINPLDEKAVPYMNLIAVLETKTAEYIEQLQATQSPSPVEA